ncbi:MAG: hypothetical protein LBB18_00500 [Puniceicoccales bacterium]|jgi:hypothetical protein|nr:hypothetical protein [Puniceicoccales bacterium]
MSSSIHISVNAVSADSNWNFGNGIGETSGVRNIDTVKKPNSSAFAKHSISAGSKCNANAMCAFSESLCEPSVSHGRIGGSEPDVGMETGPIRGETLERSYTDSCKSISNQMKVEKEIATHIAGGGENVKNILEQASTYAEHVQSCLSQTKNTDYPASAVFSQLMASGLFRKGAELLRQVDLKFLVGNRANFMCEGDMRAVIEFNASFVEAELQRLLAEIAFRRGELPFSRKCFDGAVAVLMNGLKLAKKRLPLEIIIDYKSQWEYGMKEILRITIMSAIPTKMQSTVGIGKAAEKLVKMLLSHRGVSMDSDGFKDACSRNVASNIGGMSAGEIETVVSAVCKKMIDIERLGYYWFPG